MPIQIAKHLFCPVCFKNRRKLHIVKCYSIMPEFAVYECTYCMIRMSRKQMITELKEIEEQINELKIKSSQGEWDFMSENLSFRNRALSRLNHSLFDLKNMLKFSENKRSISTKEVIK